MFPPEGPVLFIIKCHEAIKMTNNPIYFPKLFIKRVIESIDNNGAGMKDECMHVKWILCLY